MPDFRKDIEDSLSLCLGSPTEKGSELQQSAGLLNSCAGDGDNEDRGSHHENSHDEIISHIRGAGFGNNVITMTKTGTTIISKPSKSVQFEIKASPLPPIDNSPAVIECDHCNGVQSVAMLTAATNGNSPNFLPDYMDPNYENEYNIDLLHLGDERNLSHRYDLRC